MRINPIQNAQSFNGMFTITDPRTIPHRAAYTPTMAEKVTEIITNYKGIQKGDQFYVDMQSDQSVKNDLNEKGIEYTFKEGKFSDFFKFNKI